MLAPITVAGDVAVTIGLHRTFLPPDGRGKAALEPRKMTLGEVEGGAIPLFPAGPVLAIAEGIENALNVAQAWRLPAWSAVSSGNLPKVILPAIVREVVIAADRDPHGLGQRKAEEAAWRWAGEDRRVRLRLPPAGRGDWNDFYGVR